MNKIVLFLIIATGVFFSLGTVSSKDTVTAEPIAASEEKTAIFAGGCFWCVEADFEKLDGVSKAVSGYSGGAAETANYKQVSYTETGHYEVVRVHYDPAKVTFSELVEFFWRTIDPTDPDGQFCDKGSSYKTAIFYASDEEETIVRNSLASLNNSKPFDADIVTYIGPAKPFYYAEEYHQDYYLRNPIRYRFYRNGCGRDKRLEQLWGSKKKG
ncbi:MAG: peptide-methionine (S)-S-oxide reductase MsrA [Pseudomonadota bacterium]